MTNKVQGSLSVLGRLLLAAIFLSSAVGQKIPKFDDTVKTMTAVGVPQAKIMLAGAIVFLLVGSASVIFGYYARFGASLLLVFLILATYYFHNFWAVPEEAKQMQMIQFMKNLSMAGAMLFIIANGSGAASLDKVESPANR